MKTKSPLVVLQLEYPDKWAVDDAYRRLPRFGEVNIRIDKIKVIETVNMLEARGFCGILLLVSSETKSIVNIRAFKGKNGPCYDTERTAKYNGVALMVMDDDHHLFVSNMEIPICEKTANVLDLPTYSGLINTTRGNEELLAKLNDKPDLFDCDTYEENLERIFDLLRRKAPESNRSFLFYPGPFKVLILRDGTIVRRGRLNSVPESESKALVKDERLFGFGAETDVLPEYFQVEYEVRGANCLLNSKISTKTEKQVWPTDFSKLSSVHPALKKRLKKTIQGGRKYFVLTGSDPSDDLDCCPSEEVQSANALVLAGVLNSYSQPVPKDACPITTYAFKGEIIQKEDAIEMKVDQSFREEVISHLKKGNAIILHRFLKWALLIFVAFSIVFGLAQVFNNSSTRTYNSLDKQIQPEIASGTVILLFHNQKRCTQCLSMESYIRQFIKEHNAKEREIIHFKLVNMNNKQNYNLITRFKIFTATPVLVRFDEAREQNIIVLDQSWRLYNDKNAYMEMLSKALASLKTEADE